MLYPRRLELEYRKSWLIIPDIMRVEAMKEIRRARSEMKELETLAKSMTTNQWVDLSKIADITMERVFKKITGRIKVIASAIDYLVSRYLLRFAKKQDIALIKFPASQSIAQFISRNVGLISTVSEDSAPAVREAVMEALEEGADYNVVKKKIIEATGKNAKYAEFVARDQVGKALGSVTKERQESMGIERYKWRTMRDYRVRDGHEALEGQIFSWSTPPIVSTDGRREHPGGDYQCRCTAIPVI